MDDINKIDLLKINKRILGFEKFLLRRAFGLYYLTWSMAILGFITFPYILFNIYHKYVYYLILYIIIYLIIVFLGINLSKSIFRRAYRSIKLKSGYRAPKFRKINYLYMIIIIIILLSFAYFFQYNYFYYAIALYTVNILFFFLGFKILGYIKISLDNIPLEGYIAFYTYISSALATILFFIFSSFYLGNYVYFSFDFWIISVIGWMFSSFYALYHAPDEVVSNE
ncbi:MULTISPECIES: hypothetical protein [Acidiplasma]|jgi:MFS family permease|uniref:Uncharacterized protein n=2 Tax=Acidiplasma aeolicum TaxID=507754 RepID=A0A0Q0VKB7_9ARCH|nr:MULTISPECIES: hypothetical protein [Acidiplasma]KJE48625.1 hypothetical protein TZ01_08235 [Acidiplasma sp. MBA-1]KQB33925.1 hypothetical protein AOG54_06145 [Acidiplasma aeolicum]WMT55379.1 MAG: hypothetical protein RE470_01750 [Acidiplasma sp.]